MLLAASYGHIIPNSHIDRFLPLQALNIHPSLLPKYTGAAPIQWAIAQQSRMTGVTVQELSKGVFDHGRVLAQSEVVR